MTHFDNLTVLICTWNRSALLEETLGSLATMDVASTIRWEVVVVDNNSTDDTRQVVQQAARAFPAPVRYVFEPRQGKSTAMNAGLGASNAPIVAFTDDDVLVSRDWLTAISDAFRTRSDISYVGGPVDPIWERPRPAWFDRTGTILWGALAILDYGDEPFVFEDRKKVPLAANFAIRRALIDRIGNFDTAFGRNSEQVLLGQELPEFFARARSIDARWWYGKGISRARMEAIHPVTELGLDLREVATIGGVPRFLFGSAARDAGKWLKAFVRGDRGERVAAETQLCYFGGQLRERLRHR